MTELELLYAHYAVLGMEEQVVIDSLIPEEIKRQIAEVKLEFSQRRDEVMKQIVAIQGKVI